MYIVVRSRSTDFLNLFHRYGQLPYTSKEGPARIQYKSLVPIYVFKEMKLLFPKQNYNVLSPSSQDRSAYSAAGKYVNRSWEYMYKSHLKFGNMNLEIGTEIAQIQEKNT